MEYDMAGLIKNDEGEYSGTKIIFIVACSVACVWLIRDLILRSVLTETHTALIGMLMVVSLINRMSSRKYFKFEVKRDGASIETKHDDEHRQSRG